MASRLPLFRKAFGFITGYRLYSHFKMRSTKPISLPFLKHPVYFRKLESDAKMFEQIFANKEYDVAIPIDPEIILDLGANVGYASVFFANRFPTAKIFAVEPDESNFTTAQKNLAPYKNVQLVKGAVWHKSQTINLVDKGYGEAAYMVEEGVGAHEIKAYTIKEIMEIMGVGFIDILKMDVEGTEKELFEVGYDDWLPHTKVLLCETHDRYKMGTSHAVFNAVGKYDFSLELSGENLILYNNKLVTAYPQKK
jgi:FkbM family methyltransferase